MIVPHAYSVRDQSGARRRREQDLFIRVGRLSGSDRGKVDVGDGAHCVALSQTNDASLVLQILHQREDARLLDPIPPGLLGLVEGLVSRLD